MKTQNLIISLLMFSFTFVFAQYENVAIDTNSATQNEITIAISPVNSNYLKASWNEYRNSYPKTEPGYAFSTDGGLNWSDGIVPDTGIYSYGIDPSSAFDNFGNAFYCYYGRDITSQGPIMVSRTRTFAGSTDWHHAQVSDLTSNNDKPFMAVDNTISGSYSHNGRIYVTWRDGFEGYYRIRFAFSADSGKTFQSEMTLDSIASPQKTGAYFNPPPGIPSGLPDSGFVQGAMPAVGPNGEVYVAWMYVPDFNYNGGLFKICKSTNGGTTFTTPDTVDSFTYDVIGYWGYIEHVNLPSLAVDPRNGYVYVAYKDRESEIISTPRIKFVRSTDGGNSWSQTKVIGNTLGEQGEVFPWVACDSYGKVAVTFLHKDVEDSVDCYITESYDHGDNFRSPVKVSDRSSDPTVGNGPGYHYQGMVLDNMGNDYVVWTDHRHLNADPYFAKVNTPPEPPQNVTPSVVGPNQNPRIDWDANLETDLEEYEVWKKKGYGSWSLLASTPNTYYVDAGETGATFQDCVDCTPIFYKLKAVDLAGNKSGYSDTVTFNQRRGGQEKIAQNAVSPGMLPDHFVLFQNYPNPFNPTTTIQFGLPEKSKVQITVYNITGEFVTTLANGEYPAGYHQVTFDASGLASGIYLYRFKAGEFVQIRKMMVLK